MESSIKQISAAELEIMLIKIMEQIKINNPKEVINMINNGKVQITAKPQWTEKDEIIYFSVTSDGTTGAQWVTRLRRKGICVEYEAKHLCLEHLKPTNGVTYEIAILKGKCRSQKFKKSKIFSKDEVTTKNIREEAKNRKLIIPNAEIACLIREKFSYEELKAMELDRIVIMINIINEYKLFYLACDDNGFWLWLCDDYPDNEWALWSRNYGFAFIISQASSS